MAKKILNFKPKGLETQKSEDSSPSHASKQPSASNLKLAKYILSMKDKKPEEVKEVEKPIFTFFDASQTVQKNSPILKGFNVPNGYVLNISTDTTNKTIQSNEYSGGPYTYQQVLNGEVEGWSLQPIAGGVPTLEDNYAAPYDFDAQSANFQQAQSGARGYSYNETSQYPWEEANQQNNHPMYDMTAAIRGSSAPSKVTPSEEDELSVEEEFPNTHNLPGFDAQAMNAIAFEQLVNLVDNDPDGYLYGHLYGDTEMIVGELQSILAGENTDEDSIGFKLLNDMESYFSIMSKGLEDEDEIREMIQDNTDQAISTFVEGMDNLLKLKTLISMSDEARINDAIQSLKDKDIPEFMAQDGNLAALMLVDFKNLQHIFYTESALSAELENTSFSTMPAFLSKIARNESTLGFLVQTAKNYYEIGDVDEDGYDIDEETQVTELYNKILSDNAGFISNVALPHVYSFESESTLALFADRVPNDPSVMTALTAEMQLKGIKATPDTIWKYFHNFDDFIGAFPKTEAAIKRLSKVDPSQRPTKTQSDMDIVRATVLKKLPVTLAETIDMDINYGSLSRLLNGNLTPEAVISILPDHLVEMLQVSQLTYDKPQKTLDDVEYQVAASVKSLPKYIIEGKSPAESRLYHVLNYFEPDALEYLMSQAGRERLNPQTSQSFLDYVNQCVEDVVSEKFGKEGLDTAKDMVWGWTSGPGGSMSRIGMAMKVAYVDEFSQGTRELDHEWGLDKRRNEWQDHKGNTHAADYDLIIDSAKKISPVLKELRNLSQQFFRATHNGKDFNTEGKPVKPFYRGSFIEPQNPMFNDYIDEDDFIQNARPAVGTVSSFSYEERVAGSFALSSPDAKYAMVMKADATEDNLAIDCRLFNTRPFIIKLNDGNIVSVSRFTYNDYADMEAEMVVFTPFATPLKTGSEHVPNFAGPTLISTELNLNSNHDGSKTYGN